MIGTPWSVEFPAPFRMRVELKSCGARFAVDQDAVPGRLGLRRSRRAIVARAVQLVQVCRRDVGTPDDTDHAAILRRHDHRQRHQVVLDEQLERLPQVLAREQRRHPRAHQVGRQQERPGRRRLQRDVHLFEAHDPQKPPLVVDDRQHREVVVLAETLEHLLERVVLADRHRLAAAADVGTDFQAVEHLAEEISLVHRRFRAALDLPGIELALLVGEGGREIVQTPRARARSSRSCRSSRRR